MRSHEPYSFRVPQTAEPSKRYRERNREAEQKKRIKKENRRKGSGAARLRGVPRACFRDDATGGCAVHDGGAVSGACNLKSSQGRLPGPAKLRASHWGPAWGKRKRETERRGSGERREGTITKAPLPCGRKAPPSIFSRDNAANSREIHPAITGEVKRSQEATIAGGVVDAPARQWGHYKTRGIAISRKVAPTNIRLSPRVST